jgi:predicted outer membrane protein
MLRELPPHARRHCENRKTCRNFSFHVRSLHDVWLQTLFLARPACGFAAWLSRGMPRDIRPKTSLAGSLRSHGRSWNVRCSCRGVESRFIGPRTQRRESMFGKKLAVLFTIAIAGAVLAAPPSSGKVDTAEKAEKVGDALTTLHAVSQWSSKLSEMADKHAKSDLVKDYAREIASANAEKDAKLMAVAQKHSIEIGSLDPQTEEGKSLRDRIKAETVLLGSLDGDAFDKEYMTLVTNTQQSVIHYLETHKAQANDPDVKALMGDLATVVRNRLKTAQDIMTKIYGDQL